MVGKRKFREEVMMSNQEFERVRFITFIKVDRGRERKRGKNCHDSQFLQTSFQKVLLLFTLFMVVGLFRRYHITGLKFMSFYFRTSYVCVTALI